MGRFPFADMTGWSLASALAGVRFGCPDQSSAASAGAYAGLLAYADVRPAAQGPAEHGHASSCSGRPHGMAEELTRSYRR